MEPMCLGMANLIIQDISIYPGSGRSGDLGENLKDAKKSYV
jgi:hypothetical protein